MDNGVGGPQSWRRCLICAGDVTSAEVLYRVRVQRMTYAPRSAHVVPRLVRTGREARGGYVICAACWERLPGAGRTQSGGDGEAEEGGT